MTTENDPVNKGLQPITQQLHEAARQSEQLHTSLKKTTDEARQLTLVANTQHKTWQEVRQQFAGGYLPLLSPTQFSAALRPLISQGVQTVRQSASGGLKQWMQRIQQMQPTVASGVARAGGTTKVIGETLQIIGDTAQLADAISEPYANWEAGQLRLAHQLEQNKTTGLTAEQIGQLSRNIALDTLQDPTGMQSAASALLRYQQVQGNTFIEAMQLSADLAATGEGDAKTAARNLGMLLSLPIDQLNSRNRLGLQFSNEELAAIQYALEHGGRDAAQAEILKKLDSIRGAAKAEAGGLAGAKDTLMQRGEEVLIDAVAVPAVRSGYMEVANTASTKLANLRNNAFPDGQLQVDELVNKRQALKDRLKRYADATRDAQIALKNSTQAKIDALNIEIKALQEQFKTKTLPEHEADQRRLASQPALDQQYRAQSLNRPTGEQTQTSQPTATPLPLPLPVLAVERLDAKQINDSTATAAEPQSTVSTPPLTWALETLTLKGPLEVAALNVTGTVQLQQLMLDALTPHQLVLPADSAPLPSTQPIAEPLPSPALDALAVEQLNIGATVSIEQMRANSLQVTALTLPAGTVASPAQTETGALATEDIEQRHSQQQAQGQQQRQRQAEQADVQRLQSEQRYQQAALAQQQQYQRQLAAVETARINDVQKALQQSSSLLHEAANRYYKQDNDVPDALNLLGDISQIGAGLYQNGDAISNAWSNGSFSDFAAAINDSGALQGALADGGFAAPQRPPGMDNSLAPGVADITDPAAASMNPFGPQNPELMAVSPLAQTLDGEKQFQQQSTQSWDSFRQSEEAREMQHQQFRLASNTALFGNLAGLAKKHAGEQSALYKVMFAATKAHAIATSIVRIKEAMANAASQTFPLNIAAIATVIAQTAGIVSTIKGTQLQGVAHAGIDAVPREGTWLLDGGERVVAPQQNRDLTRFLAQQSNGGPNVQIINNGAPASARASLLDDGTLQIILEAVDSDQAEKTARGTGIASQTMERTYGLNRAMGVG